MRPEGPTAGLHNRPSGPVLPGAGLQDAGFPDATVGVAPHSLRAVTPDELTALTAMGAGGPMPVN